MRFFGTEPIVRGTPTTHMVVVATVVLISMVAIAGRSLSGEPFHLCCSTEDCTRRYAVKPNLELAARTHVSGSIQDPAGEALSFSKVELRRWISPTRQVSMRTVMTDANGRFDAGQIEKGRYRLLPSPVSYMRQPQNFACPYEECELHIELRATATDTQEALCPVR